MYDLELLERRFKHFACNLSSTLPEGLIEVDLALLHRLNLLHYHSSSPVDDEPQLTRYFQVLESYEKITLINDTFAVWIVPVVENYRPATYTLIALMGSSGPHLELAFVTRGVYNSSKLVLRLLEKLLWDIEENQEVIQKLENSSY